MKNYLGPYLCLILTNLGSIMVCLSTPEMLAVVVAIFLLLWLRFLHIYELPIWLQFSPGFCHKLLYVSINLND